MTRVVVFKEGTFLRPDVFVTKGALKMTEDVIPITIGSGPRVDEFVGKASEFQRDEETGEVSVNVEFFEPFKEMFEDSNTAYAFDASNIEALKANRNQSNVMSARVRQVVAVPFGKISKAIPALGPYNQAKTDIPRTEKYFKETLGSIEVVVYNEGDKTLDLTIDDGELFAYGELDYERTEQLIAALIRAQAKLKRD